MGLGSLSIGVACYNDAQTIEDVVMRAAETAGSVAARFRVLVVDDGSSDDSAARVRVLADRHAWLEARFHPANLGFGATFRELYSYAECEFNAILPGDGQIPPAEIAEMAAAMKDADVVLGVREKRQDSVRRRANSSVYNRVISVVAGEPIAEVNSIAISRTSLVRTFSLRSRSAFIHAEFLLRCIEAGGRVRHVPIRHEPRRHGAGAGGRLSVIVPTVAELAAYVLRRRRAAPVPRTAP